jgi:hypothetical protein
MKIAAICITYLRPQLLFELIRMFELQSWPDRQLVVLDDTGQYEPCSGDRWTVHSIDSRFMSIGAKRNAAMDLADEDADAFAVWDDDDVYLPWALAATENGLRDSAWAAPAVVFDHWKPGGLIVTKTDLDSASLSAAPAYHGSWSYRRETIDSVGRYPDHQVGDLDCEVGWKILAKYGHPKNTICDQFPHPYYIYNRHADTYNAGMMTDGEIIDMKPVAGEKMVVMPTWPTSYNVLWGLMEVRDRAW